jgi:preprotein translocase subunit SecE
VAEKIAKSKQADRSKQTGRIARWWRETIGELHKVSWPTIPEARRLTGIVLAVMAIMAIVLGILDLGFSFLVGLIVG